MPTLLWILLALLVVFAVAALATRPGAAMTPVEADRADVVLPEGRVHAADVRSLRFGMVLRGYRMSEVDRVLDRLAEELSARDAELDELRGAGAYSGEVVALDADAPTSGDSAFGALPAEGLAASPTEQTAEPTADAGALSAEPGAEPTADAGAVSVEPVVTEVAPADPQPPTRRTSAFDVADWSMPDVESADGDADSTPAAPDRR